MSVEIGESQERLKFFLFGWYWPVKDAFDLDRVHVDASFADDDAQVFCLQDFELAFLGFKEQFVFP